LKGDEEMKKFKYSFALVAFCLGLVGCGNNANVPDGNGNANTNTNDSMNDNGTNGTNSGATGNMYTRDMAEERALATINGRVDNYTERFDEDEPHHLFEIVNDDNERYSVRVHRETGEVMDYRRMTEYND